MTDNWDHDLKFTMVEYLDMTLSMYSAPLNLNECTIFSSILRMRIRILRIEWNDEKQSLAQQTEES